MSQQEVLDVVQRLATAELNGDIDAFDELLAADFSGVGPVGFVLDKQQWTDRHRGDLKNEELTISGAEVRLYGDTAVVIAVQAQKATVRGHDAVGEFRIGLVVTKQDGSWRIANVQLSGPMIAPGQRPPFAKPE